jgi:membrane protein YqaA with SNARE-associated domain
MKRFFIYLLRWQLSSPILALCLSWLEPYNVILASIIANLIGGCIFYFIDKLIFKEK